MCKHIQVDGKLVSGSELELQLGFPFSMVLDVLYVSPETGVAYATFQDASGTLANSIVKFTPLACGHLKMCLASDAEATELMGMLYVQSLGEFLDFFFAQVDLFRR